MINIIKHCPMCGKEYYISMEDKEYELYLKGLSSCWSEGDVIPIQDVLPTYNSMEREFLKTGYCPECQRLLFNNNLTSNKIKEKGV